MPVEIYVYRDSHGWPLYVGITGRPEEREGEHAYRSKWIRYKAGKESLEQAETFEDALAREAYLIRTLKPIFNIQQARGDWRERREAYLRLVDPEVLSTDDGTSLLWDAEAIALESGGAKVGPAMRYVLAKWNDPDYSIKRVLVMLAERQDASGECHCAFASRGEMRSTHGGDRFVCDRAFERMRVEGWISRRLVQGMHPWHLGEEWREDDHGFERSSWRVPEDDSERQQNAADAKPRGRRR